MSKYTHIVIDNLGSFPAIGDTVLEVSLSGQYQKKRITAMSSISELPLMRWAYVALIDAERPGGRIQQIEDWHAFPHAISLDAGDA